MQHIGEFFSELDLENSRFLVIGKGPSVARLNDTSRFDYTVSLNHALRDYSVDFSHIIDLDVVDSLDQIILDNAKYLIMPLYPHVNSAPSKKSLLDFIEDYPVLRALNDQNRLLWYNLGTKKKSGNSLPVVPGGYFSGDVIVSLLSSNGARNFTMAGVDGGKTYADGFSDLNQSTLLSNGRSSFDIQFDNIRRFIMERNLNYNHIEDEYPVKVYVATTEAQMLATKVLEYSIRKHSSVPVEVVAIHELGIEYKEPKDVENRQRTPFSFQRFLIPSICNYQGRAIYLDSDMQVFTDIKELWSLPMGGDTLLAAKSRKGEGRKPHFSVMLIDCERNAWDINKIIDCLDNNNFSYSDLMDGMVVSEKPSAGISCTWNSLEYFKEGETKLIHYTDMKTQPWVSTKNPFEEVWVRELISAVNDGSISIDYIRSHISNGWVRPSLEDQVTLGIESSKGLSSDILAKDRDFSPPYNELICGYSDVSSNILKRLWVKVIKTARYLKR